MSAGHHRRKSRTATSKSAQYQARHNILKRHTEHKTPRNKPVNKTVRSSNQRWSNTLIYLHSFQAFTYVWDIHLQFVIGSHIPHQTVRGLECSDVILKTSGISLELSCSATGRKSPWGFAAAPDHPGSTQQKGSNGIGNRLKMMRRCECFAALCFAHGCRRGPSIIYVDFHIVVMVRHIFSDVEIVREPRRFQCRSCFLVTFV